MCHTPNQKRDFNKQWFRPIAKSFNNYHIIRHVGVATCLIEHILNEQIFHKNHYHMTVNTGLLFGALAARTKQYKKNRAKIILTLKDRSEKILT